MTVCVIKLCRNYKGRLKSSKHVTYHRIPNNPFIRNLWIDRIQKSRGEAMWKPTKSTVVCSEHFRSKDMYAVHKTGRRRLTKGAVPCKALFLSSVKSSGSDNSEDIEIAEKYNSTEAGPSGIYKDICHSEESSDNLEIDDINIPNSNITYEIISDKTVEVQNKTEAVAESFSDPHSTLDTLRKAKLRQVLRPKLELEKKYIFKIKSLTRKNQRLKKTIASFKQIIATLKKEQLIDQKTLEFMFLMQICIQI